MDVSKYRELTDEDILKAFRMAVNTAEERGDEFKDIAGANFTRTILGISFQTALDMIIDEKNQIKK